jgi:hypothetical protein
VNHETITLQIQITPDTLRAVLQQLPSEVVALRSETSEVCRECHKHFIPSHHSQRYCALQGGRSGRNRRYRQRRHAVLPAVG